MEHIEDEAFVHCISLNKLSFSNVTTIGTRAFAHCGLTSIEIQYVSQLGSHCFEGCKSLLHLKLPAVTVIPEFAFANCESLQLEIPHMVTRIGDHAFWCCKSLTHARIPSGVMLIETQTFEGCDAWFCSSICLKDIFGLT